MAAPTNGVREQLRELRSEVERLRQLADIYIPRIAVIENQIVSILARIAELEDDVEETKLDAREFRTNWKLAVFLGGLVGTLIVGVMLWIGTTR